MSTESPRGEGPFHNLEHTQSLNHNSTSNVDTWFVHLAILKLEVGALIRISGWNFAEELSHQYEIWVNFSELNNTFVKVHPTFTRTRRCHGRRVREQRSVRAWLSGCRKASFPDGGAADTSPHLMLLPLCAAENFNRQKLSRWVRKKEEKEEEETREFSRRLRNPRSHARHYKEVCVTVHWACVSEGGETQRDKRETPLSP